MLLIKTSLNNFSPIEQSFFEGAHVLRLYLHGRFLFQLFNVLETALFESCCKIVLFSCLCSVILVLLLAHLHLITRLLVNTLLEDAHEDVFRILLNALLIDSHFAVGPHRNLSPNRLLLLFDVVVTAHLQRVNLLLNLLVFGLFLIDAVSVGVDPRVTNEIFAVPVEVRRSNSTLLIVVVDVNTRLVHVKLSFLDLLSGGLLRIQLKLLSHLLYRNFLLPIIVNLQLQLI